MTLTESEQHYANAVRAAQLHKQINQTIELLNALKREYNDALKPVAKG